MVSNTSGSKYLLYVTTATWLRLDGINRTCSILRKLTKNMRLKEHLFNRYSDFNPCSVLTVHCCNININILHCFWYCEFWYCEYVKSKYLVIFMKTMLNLSSCQIKHSKIWNTCLSISLTQLLNQVTVQCPLLVKFLYCWNIP